MAYISPRVGIDKCKGATLPQGFILSAVSPTQAMLCHRLGLVFPADVSADGVESIALSSPYLPALAETMPTRNND